MECPEAQNRQLEAGQSVEVYSRRSDQFNTTGHIRFVHPGFSRMPERLWLRGQMLWVRKFRVELAPHHSLLPGESVLVRVLEGGKDAAATSGAGALSEDGSAIAVDGDGISREMAAAIESRKRRSHVSIGS